jgi:hypothetical protein
MLNSCQEVVPIDLNTANPKIVIEAAINWQKGTSGNIQKIKLSTTTNFYSNSIPVVSGATVFVTSSTNAVFNFIEIPNTGEYICNNFLPVLNQNYALTIINNGKTYTASETLKPVATIIDVVQESNGGFSGNRIRIKANYLDPASTQDYYLFNYKYPGKAKPDLYVSEDKFYNGNPFFSISFEDKLKAGDTITLIHFGISKQYFEYLNILLDLAGNQGGGGPFQAPPVTVRGNITNVSNPDDFPFGYFSLSETDQKNYTIN